MKERKKKLKRWTYGDVIVLIVALFCGAITLYPMVYVLSCSISDPVAVMGGKVKLWPVGFTLNAYEIVVQNRMMWRSMLNSVGYVVVSCALLFLTTAGFAYALTRPNLKFRTFVTYFLLVPMYVSAGMIPTFLVFTKLGLYNNPLAMVLPGVSIYYIILCRTYMASISNELLDAAFIDGADQIKALTKVVIPLSKPVFAVIMIYNIVNQWNSWFPATIYLTSTKWHPIQLYLKTLLSKTTGVTEEMLKYMPRDLIEILRAEQMSYLQLKYSVIFIVAAPIIAVYPLFQKHFVKGVMLGSLKG